MRVRSPSPASFAGKLAIAVYILADESLVNRIMGNFLIDGYESKSYGLKMVKRTDWSGRPKLLTFSFFYSFLEEVIPPLSACVAQLDRVTAL